MSPRGHIPAIDVFNAFGSDAAGKKDRPLPTLSLVGPVRDSSGSLIERRVRSTNATSIFPHNRFALMECKLKDYPEASTETVANRASPWQGRARIKKINHNSKLGWMVVLCELVGQSDAMKAP